MIFNRALLFSNQFRRKITMDDKPDSIGVAWRLLCLAIFILMSATGLYAQDQDVHPAYEAKGLTAYEEFRGAANNEGQFLIFDTNFGYDFNQHVGTDIGIPVYVLHPTLPGTPHNWGDSLGDPYWDLRLAFPNHFLNYDTAFTVSVPANETGAYSTGRLGLDWFSHFDHAFGPVSPFVNAGIANGILDTRFLSQPFRLTQSFRTLGFIADTEGGMNFRLARSLSIGGSYYALLPSGQQKAYAGVQNFFLLPTTTETVSQVTHDRGYTAYLRLTPTRSLFIEGAYVHSLELNTDAATLTVGVDVRSLFNRPRAQQHY
jgi:hypothetical protein